MPTALLLLLLLRIFILPVDAHELDSVEAAHMIREALLPPPARLDPTNYIFEFAALVALVAVVVVAFLGRRANAQIAEDWMRSCKDQLQSQFAKIGGDTTYLESTGWCSYELWCTGRKSCMYTLIKLELRPRPCPWLNTLLHLVVPQCDQIYFEANVDAMKESFTVALTNRLTTKAMQQSHPNLEDSKLFRKVVEGLSTELQVITDCSDAANFVFNDSVKQMICKNVKFVKSILASDLVPGYRSQNDSRVVSAHFILPEDPASRASATSDFINLFCEIVDRVADVRLFEGAKKEVGKLRTVLLRRQRQNEEADRREVVAARRTAKAKESEDKYNRMTNEEKRKFEEKERKANAKKSQTKMMKIKKV